MSDIEAQYYDREGGDIRCKLCPHACLIPPGRAGLCGMRVHREGRLFASGYGVVSAVALDPIEKKPLRHFFPGSTILSLGSFGCNLRCQFCQNWQISQAVGPPRCMTPQEALCLALDSAASGSIGIAFTYNEPVIWYEYVLDTAGLARAAGQKTVLVTNGYLAPDPWRRLIARIDALNVDVKGWDEAFYRRMCGGSLRPVLENILVAGELCHVELTYLLIPGHNDDDQSVEGFARWVRTNLGARTPVHFSRYFPNYKLEIAPTPITTLRRAQELAGRWLDLVYLGNVGI